MASDPRELLKRAQEHFQLGDYGEVEKSVVDALGAESKRAKEAGTDPDRHFLGEACFLRFRAKAEQLSSAPLTQRRALLSEAFGEYMKAVGYNHDLMLFNHDKFAPLELLGVGGTSYVFSVRVTNPDKSISDPKVKTLALKAIKEEFSQKNRELRRELYTDIKTLQKLQHQNVTKVFQEEDISEMDFLDRKYLYILQEEFEGETLQDVLHRLKRRLDSENETAVDYIETVQIMCQVCGGLIAAHEKGIYHGDLKPENILVNRDKMKVKVTDFGLVNFLEHASQRDSRRLIGMPQYMCPERYESIRLEHPAQCDIYAVGVILWEALAGAKAYQARYRSVFESNPELATDIKLIIELCTTVEPSDWGYQSAQEVKNDLESFQSKLEKSGFSDSHRLARSVQNALAILLNTLVGGQILQTSRDDRYTQNLAPIGSFVSPEDLRVPMALYRSAWIVPTIISVVYLAKFVGYPLGFVDDKLTWVKHWFGCDNDKLFLATFLVGPFAWLAYLYYHNLLIFTDPAMSPLASLWLELQLFVYMFPMLLGYICPELWAVSSGIGIGFVAINNFSLWLYLRQWKKYYSNVASHLRDQSARRMIQWSVGTFGGAILLITFGLVWFQMRKQYPNLPNELDYLFASLVLVFGILRSVKVNVLGDEARDLRDTFVVERRLRQKHRQKNTAITIRGSS